MREGATAEAPVAGGAVELEGGGGYGLQSAILVWSVMFPLPLSSLLSPSPPLIRVLGRYRNLGFLPLHKLARIDVDLQFQKNTFGYVGCI